MVTKRTWKEFKDSGLLWWINMILHTFGWAIVVEVENAEIKNVYPARVKFRGFDEGLNTDGYKTISKHMLENAEEIYKESTQ